MKVIEGSDGSEEMDVSEMTQGRFRKRPVEVDAIRFLGPDNCAEVFDWLRMDHDDGEGVDHDEIDVTTIHGDAATVRVGDWIVREPMPGRFYPVKPDVFEATYEPAEVSP